MAPPSQAQSGKGLTGLSLANTPISRFEPRSFLELMGSQIGPTP